MRITTRLIKGISIVRFYRMQAIVDFEPPYQRESNVWKPDAQGLLIDSIINGFDIPKLYFEVQHARRYNEEGIPYEYAVLDGKQRLEAIVGFINGKVKLPEDFMWFDNEDSGAQGFSFSELQESYPQLANRFLSFELPVVEVDSESGDLIEEMFQRLNASSSLNAAERRNAITCSARDAANTLAKHELLVKNSPIRSARFKYRELGAKFLVIEHQLTKFGKIKDTKASTLYQFFIDSKLTSLSISADEMDKYRQNAETVLDCMSKHFEEEDRLLASIGTVVVLYIAFRDDGFAAAVDRKKLEAFEDERRKVAQMPDSDDDSQSRASAALRRYNGLVQSTNDGAALERRAEILHAFVCGYSSAEPLAGLDTDLDGEPPSTDESEEF